MLHNKDIKNLSEFKSDFVDSHKNPFIFSKIIDLLKLGKYQALFSTVKSKGFSALSIIQILLTFPFIGAKNIYGFTQKYMSYSKDVYYRLMNNPKINWRSFLLSVALNAYKTMINRELESETGKNKKTIKAFIFDDTPLSKRGYKIEGVSKIFDHIIKKHILGYHLLVMGLYTGNLFIPLNFSFHREKGNDKSSPYGLKKKVLQKQFSKKRNIKTAGAERKKELDISKIISMLQMLKSALRKGITADYVITDSWYTCWETVKTTIDSGLHYIGMFSKVKTKFEINNKQLTYKEIRHINRKNIKRNKRFNLYYIRNVVQWNGKKIILYAIRKGKGGKWKYILSTDLSLNFTETIKIYQLRWSIEVFFKESKQLFNLGKNQAQDFDSQIADTTLRMIEYIFIAIQQNAEKYESVGKLFQKNKDQVIELKLHERLVLLLIEIIKLIEILFKEADYEETFKNVIYNQQALNKLLNFLKNTENESKKAA